MTIMKKTNKLQKGYGLVELAMSLAIVAILMGGLFFGKSLIENAKMKAVINEFDSFSQAYFTYLKRMGRPPGMWVTSYYGTLDQIRPEQMMSDLFEEGLIVAPDSTTSSTGERFALNPYGGKWYFASNGNVPPIYAGKGIQEEMFGNRLRICTNYLPTSVAQGIDTKLDDGVPNTGNIMSFMGGVVTDYATVDSKLALESASNQRRALMVCKII